MPELTDFQQAVAEVVQATSPGDVLTYSDVAAEAGYPGAARAVGHVLRSVPNLAWWRVVTATGRLTPGKEKQQAALLTKDGVKTMQGFVQPND